MIAFPNSYFAQRELVVLTVGGYDSVTMLIRALKMKKLISDYLWSSLRIPINPSHEPPPPCKVATTPGDSSSSSSWTPFQEITRRLVFVDKVKPHYKYKFGFSNAPSNLHSSFFCWTVLETETSVYAMIDEPWHDVFSQRCYFRLLLSVDILNPFVHSNIHL